MKNLIWKVSLKWALFLTIIALIPQVISTFAHNPEGPGQWISVVFGFLFYIAIFVCLGWAHIEFHNKNENYISFGNAIIIGLTILIICSIISGIYHYFNYEFVLKDRIASQMTNLSEETGMDMNEYMPSGRNKMMLTFINYSIPFILLFFIISVEAQWKIYKKAGKPGWAIFIPIYNILVYLQIIKKPFWWLFLLFIPFVNIIFAIWMTNLLSLRFGKSEGFTFGLLMLPFVFFPLLGLSKAEYIEDIKSNSE